MRRWPEIAGLPFSSMGRLRLLSSLRYRLWPILFPFARLWRRTLARRVRLVAVVGSFGKTTTTRAIVAALGGDPEPVVGWNAGGLLAEAVLRIRPKDRLAVIEVGIRTKGQMARYARLLRPDVVVVTSIGLEHHRSLGSLDDIRWEKSEMVRGLQRHGIAVLNRDDPNVLWMQSQTDARVMTYGFDPASDISASAYENCGAEGGTVSVSVAGRTRRMALRLVGRHSVYSALAGLAVAHEVSEDLDSAMKRLADLAPTPHRVRPVQPLSGGTLLMDDYKAVLETIEIALRGLGEMPARRRIAVLGEVFEPPGDESEAYRHLGRLAAMNADTILFVGCSSAFHSLREGVQSKGAQGPVLFDAGGSVRAVADALRSERLAAEDLVLVKGIGYQRLERIPLILDGVAVRCERIVCHAPIILACRDCPER